MKSQRKQVGGGKPVVLAKVCKIGRGEAWVQIHVDEGGDGRKIRITPEGHRKGWWVACSDSNKHGLVLLEGPTHFSCPLYPDDTVFLVEGCDDIVDWVMKKELPERREHHRGDRREHHRTEQESSTRPKSELLKIPYGNIPQGSGSAPVQIPVKSGPVKAETVPVKVVTEPSKTEAVQVEVAAAEPMFPTTVSDMQREMLDLRRHDHRQKCHHRKSGFGKYGHRDLGRRDRRDRWQP